MSFKLWVILALFSRIMILYQLLDVLSNKQYFKCRPRLKRLYMPGSENSIVLSASIRYLAPSLIK